jgi:RHS repeat-associated protein
VLWGLTDHQGSVRDVVSYSSDSQETRVVGHVEYDAFGNIVSGQADGSGQSVVYAYTGRVWDADSELYYYRARWYDPEVGRFISEDPIGFAAGDVNINNYVGGSPTNYTDPSGLDKYRVFPQREPTSLARHLAIAIAKANPAMSAEEAFMCITQSRTRIEKGRLALVVRVNEPPETPWWEGTKAFFSEAAFQIGNAVADEIPYVGQVKGGAELAAGHNVRGEKLGRFDRAMAGLNMVPGGGLVGRVLKGGKVAIGGAMASGRAVIRRLSRVTAKNADKADEVVDVVRASSGGGRARAPSRSRSLFPVAPRVRSVDELLVNGAVPSNRGGAFNRWFDNLTPDELDALWRSDRQIGSSSIRELIEDRIRNPGGLHEWLMAGRANKFKRWGVGMDTIKELRTVITDRALKLKRPSDLPSHIAPAIPRGYHSGPLSGRFHYELRALIDASRNYSDFTLRMRRFAERWLPNGIQDLPPGLIQ